RSLVGMVFAKVATAALGALERRARDRLSDVEEVPEIERRVPGGVVIAIADRPRARRARPQRADALERLAQLRIGAHDADVLLHQLLEVALHGVRDLAAVALVEGRQCLAPGALERGVVDPGPATASRVRRRVVAGALAEDQEIGERVATETIGAVDPGCT